MREEEIPADLVELATEKKLELISCLAECGDEYMEENYLEENIDIPEETLKEAIRKYTLTLEFCPVFMGSAYKNKGV